MRYAFLLDIDKCIGCRGCAMACKNYQQLEPEMVWRQVYPLAPAIYPHPNRAFLSLSCNHCDHPVCQTACPANCYFKREDGIVVHDNENCVGCGNCIRSCPYGAPRRNPVAKKAEKCSMCYERIDAGLLPACVQGCVTGALTLINLEDFVASEAVQYPQGYPVMPGLNPSTRFILPKLPILGGVKS